jgi:Na+/phosphate symporter
MPTSAKPIQKGILFSESDWKEAEELMAHTGLNFSYLIRTLLREAYQSRINKES